MISHGSFGAEQDRMTALPIPLHPSRGVGPRRGARALLAVALLLGLNAVGIAARADDSLGTVGLGDGYYSVLDLAYGKGSRIGESNKLESSFALYAHFEAGKYFKVSEIGTLAGVEFGFNGGKDLGTRAKDSFVLGIPLMMDVWVDFPVTLLNLGNGKHDWLRWALSPGFGASFIHAYVFLKTTVAMRVPVLNDDVELAWLWWPDAGSFPVGDTHDGFNAATLRGSWFLGSSWHAFAEIHKTQQVHSNGNKAPTMTRTDWDSVANFGFGMRF